MKILLTSLNFFCKQYFFDVKDRIVYISYLSNTSTSFPFPSLFVSKEIKRKPSQTPRLLCCVIFLLHSFTSLSTVAFYGTLIRRKGNSVNYEINTSLPGSGSRRSGSNIVKKYIYIKRKTSEEYREFWRIRKCFPVQHKHKRPEVQGRQSK